MQDSHRVIRRTGWVVWVLAALCVVIGAPGCGEPAREREDREPMTTALPEDVGDPVDGDWLLTRLPAEMDHLNPYTISDAYASGINSLIFDGLLDRNNETLEMEPNLAEAWEISEDKLEYTFYLREELIFSDGEPLTAHDVKFSFDTMMNPEHDTAFMRNYYKDVTDCEVIDERTVRFTCSIPYFRHLVMLGAFEIIPEHIYGEGDFNNHPNNRRPIGSGPYVFERWDTGQQVVLARNERYWGEKPHILKRVYKIISDENAAFQVLSRGNLDNMNLSAEQWVNRANTARFEAQFNKFAFYAPSYSYIGWNSRRPQFSDRRVRRALTMLLDREEIAEHIYYGLAIPVTGNFFIDSPEYNQDITPVPFDPAQAIELLEEAGWKDTTGDGVRDKDGVAFRFELLIVSASVQAEQIATVFQEQLRRAGIVMTIRPLEWATFTQSIDGRNFDACMLGWSMPPDPDPYQVWHSSQAEAGSNYVGFNNPEADQLIEKARETFDRDERIVMYHRFHEILHEEQPYTFLFCRKNLLAVDRRFHGIVMYPFGPDSKEWWVPEALQRYP